VKIPAGVGPVRLFPEKLWKTSSKHTNSGEILSKIPDVCCFETTSAKITGYSDLP